MLFHYCLSVGMTYGQATGSRNIKETIEDIMEIIAANTDEEIDYHELIETMQFYLDNPLDLNSATESDLQKIMVLTDMQISSIKKHISIHGKLLSIFELQAIEGLNLKTIYAILPFLTVNRSLNHPNISLPLIIKNGHHEVIARLSQDLQRARGFKEDTPGDLIQNPNQKYLGSPQSILMKYRFKYSNHVNMGVTGEKDSGEEFLKKNQSLGFDFLSTHFSVQQIGNLKSLCIGDYHARFGQGLTCWSGSALANSLDGLNLKRSLYGITPYTSTNEARFMRGIANSWRVGSFEFSGFFSLKRINTNLDTIKMNEEKMLAFSSIDYTGYHRTFSEISRKQNVSEKTIGTNIRFIGKKMHLGLTAIKCDFNQNFIRNKAPYQYYFINGRSFSNIGIDFNAVVRNIHFYGEVAYGFNRNYAGLIGAIASLDENFSISVLHRNYSKTYQAAFGEAYRQGPGVSNEHGTCLSILMSPWKKYNIQLSYDLWKHPWLRYQSDAPVNCSDMELKISYQYSKKLETYFRYQKRNKPQNSNSDEESYLNYPSNIYQQRLRFEIDYKFNKTIGFRNRIEYITSDHEVPGGKTEKGYMMLQDLSLKPVGKRWSFHVRYAVYRTDNYNTRIYAYENDVLYAYSIPPYYDWGSRLVLNVEYSLNRKVDLWIRYARFKYFMRDTIGSGLSEIDGSVKSSFRIQLRMKF